MFCTLPLLALLSISCRTDRGTLIFKANGEDFIACGFTSKEGWELSFDSLRVNLDGIEAYNPEDTSLKAGPAEALLIDLTKNDGTGTDVTVSTMHDVPAGNYQSLRFSLKQIEEGENKGYSIIISGTAKKGNRRIPFIISLDEELTFDGREGYVGDSIKGLLAGDKETEVEMTFHFDHLFGDYHAPPDAHVNSRSPGFALFLHYENDGIINVAQEDMKNHGSYPLLISAIETLGHLGEGHCEVVR